MTILKTKILFACVLILIMGCIVYNSYRNKQEIIIQILAIAQANGLENINVLCTEKNKEYGWYYATIDCSNLNELSNNQLLLLDKKMSELNARITKYTSNGDEYIINSSVSTIYKNGKKIYKEYSNEQKSFSCLKGVNGTYTYRCLRICSDKCGNACEVCLMNGNSFKKSPFCTFDYSASKQIGWIGCPDCGDISSKEWFDWYEKAL